MANSAIKGITIQLGADASELTTALYNADNALKNTQKQLRSVETALKFNPGNVELLGQKMTLLTRSIDESEDYIKRLKEGLDALKAQGVSETSDEFMALQRELIQAESKQESFKRQLNDTENALDHVKSATSGYDAEIDALDSDTKKASGSLSAFSVAMGNLAARGIEKLASAISGQLDSAISRVDTLNAYSRTMQNLGYTAEEAEKAQTELVDSIQTLPTSLDSIVGVQQQYAALYGDIEKATDLTIALNDATIAGGQGQEAATRAMDAWYKVLAKGKPEAEQWQTLNETMPAQMNQIAQALLGTEAKSQDLFKAWQDGTVTTDEVTGALLSLDKEGGGSLASFSEQAEGASAGIETSITNLKTAITRGLTEAIEGIGTENIQAVIGKITDGISKAGSVVGGFFTKMVEYKDVLIPIAAGIGAIVTAMATWSAITKTITILQTALNAVLMANPIGLVTLAIIGLVAAFATAYKRSESFRNAVNRMIATMKSMWNTVKAAAAGVIAAFNSLKARVSGAVQSIKSAISNAFSNMASIGTAIVQGIWNGISGGLGWIKSKISGWVGNVKSFLKNLFGIGSPSKWARDEIGYNVVRGLALGLADNAGIVDSAMQSLMPTMSVGMSSLKTATGSSGGMNAVINVYGSDGMNVDELALKVRQKIIVLEKQRRQAWA